jgi:hypothetical protein
MIVEELQEIQVYLERSMETIRETLRSRIEVIFKHIAISDELQRIEEERLAALATEEYTKNKAARDRQIFAIRDKNIADEAREAQMLEDDEEEE